ncbi:MAG TPA: hypothetical protein VMW75_26275 [Thermoanaerobaculia bacterium]|nr:hypothetical protein [Thermoanaerobaculia bacterium]
MEPPRQTSWLRRCLWAAFAFGAAFAIGCATGPGQPHMVAALDELRAARAELQAALPDKGGHRVRAIELVDDAIGQVRRGIDYSAGRY